MIKLDTTLPTRLGGTAKPFADNNYARALFGIVHPILSTLGLAWKCLTAPSEIFVNTEQTKFTGRLVLRALNLTSGTVLLATATVGALQLAAVHWGVLATISTLLAGAGISIGSFGIVPLILGCCLVVGFASAFLSNCLEKRALSKLPKIRYVLDTKTHADKGKALALLILKTIILPWGICACIKHLVQRAVMIAVHPGQNWIRLMSSEERKSAKTQEQFLLKMHREHPDVVKPIVLKKNGVEYSGWMLTNPKNTAKGNWILQGVQSYQTAEDAVYDILMNDTHINPEFNVLVMNPPGVGHSQGTSTPETLGEVQELALTFLEEPMQAKNIAMIGRSLGGAGMGVATLNHTFKTDSINYVSIPQLTFGSLAHLSQEMMRTMAPCLTTIAFPLIRSIGFKMDAVEGFRRLAELDIPVCVINRKNSTGEYIHDDVIPAIATLGAKLESLGLQPNETTSYQEPTGELIPLNFSHDNTIEITALTARILQKWYRKTDYLPNVAQKRGRQEA